MTHSEFEFKLDKQEGYPVQKVIAGLKTVLSGTSWPSHSYTIIFEILKAAVEAGVVVLPDEKSKDFVLNVKLKVADSELKDLERRLSRELDLTSCTSTRGQARPMSDVKVGDKVRIKRGADTGSYPEMAGKVYVVKATFPNSLCPSIRVESPGLTLFYYSEIEWP